MAGVWHSGFDDSGFDDLRRPKRKRILSAVKGSTRVLAMGVLLSCGTFAQAQLPTCLAMVEKPTYYPPLARMARIYGVVTLNFQIGQDGRPLNTVLDGNGILTKEIESILNRSVFDPQCTRRIELVYRFVLDGEDGSEAHTSIAFNPPNEYVVTSNPYGPICLLPQADRRKSWIKRLFTGK